MAVGHFVQFRSELLLSYRVKNKTFYVRNGDYLGRLGLFVGVLLVLYSITKSVKNKQVEY